MRAVEERTTIHATLLAKINGVYARIMPDGGAGSSYTCTSLIRKLGIYLFKTERIAIEQMRLRVRCESGRNTFAFQGATIYNNLPSDIRNEKYFINFKRKINAYSF